MPADALGASGVLATVSAGIYMGIRGLQILPARTRLQGYFVWDILDFIINAILFVLIGLQRRVVVKGLSGYSATALGGYALAVTGVVVGTRLGWFITVPSLIRAIDRRPTPSAACGTPVAPGIGLERDAGSCVAGVALALPFTTNTGSGFPQRDLIVFSPSP